MLGTGDFTHPAWLKELDKLLIEAEPGFFKLKHEPQKDYPFDISPDPISIRFVLTAEIFCIYRKNNRVRKNHNLILVPDFESIIKINKRLSKIANLETDGRPILKLDVHDLLEIVLKALITGY